MDHLIKEGISMENRVEKAAALFEAGHNCCQAVFAAYGDLFGIDRDTALRLASGMGAGMGRMREVCGAVSAMAMLAGLKLGQTDPGDRDLKTRTYELVRRMSDEFRQINGSIVCRELLGLRSREKSAAPSERTKEYYEKRPCTKHVRDAACIVEKYLL